VTNVEWHERTHFFALAAQMMRRILVDRLAPKFAQARRRGAQK